MRRSCWLLPPRLLLFWFPHLPLKHQLSLEVSAQNQKSLIRQKDAEEDLSFEATTDSSNNVSIEATTATLYSASLPSMHVSSGASTDATTEGGSELSVEEDGDASTEATAEFVVSMKPTTTTEYRTNPPESEASTDVERELAGSDVSTEANPKICLISY